MYLRKTWQSHELMCYLKNRFYWTKKLLHYKFPIQPPINNPDLAIHILTGWHDFRIMIWSLASFFKYSNLSGQLYIHSDGTIKKWHIKIIKKLFPEVKLTFPDTFVQLFKTTLDKYPLIKEFRTNYSNWSLKKIIEPYFASPEKIHLIFDSDIQWFSKPMEIEDNIAKGCPISYMTENNVSIPTIFKDGTKMDNNKARMNAGIMLYHKNNMDLNRLTEFLDRLDRSIPNNMRIIDQAGHAYSLKNLEALPAKKYHIKGRVNESTVTRHYTGPRRQSIYTEGIEKLRKIIL